MKQLSRYGKNMLAATVGIWALSVLFVVVTETRFPGTDIFLFKDPAVNFALKGKLVATNLAYMPMDKEMPFAHYPPVYPTVFGLWLKIFGVGLKQSLLFECVIRGLRSLMLGAIIWPVLKESLNDRKRRLWGALSVLLLVLLSISSTDDDRPDELGLVIGLSSWWILLRAQRLYQYGLCGLLLGLTGATSPACAVAMGLGILSYFGFQVKKIRPLIWVGVGALISFLACVSPVLLAHGEVLKRFSVSARASSIPYNLPGSNGMTWNRFLARIRYCLDHYLPLGFNFVFCFFCVLVVSFFSRFHRKVEFHPFQISSICFVLMAPFIWSLQPYYLWFAVLPLAVLFLAGQLEKEGTHKFIAFFGVFMAFAPAFFHEAKIFISVTQRPSQESSGYVRERLLQHIKPGERVAISHDQFFTLRNYREVADINFVCHFLSKFNYVYVTRMNNSKQGLSPEVPIPCWSVAQVGCFDPVDNLSTSHPLIISGWNTGFITRGNGGTLYRNTRCSEKIPRHVAAGFQNQF